LVVTVFEFGEFKLDSDRFDLSRAGRSLKLEKKPMELLILLAARNGHLVTRTEIAQRLWGSEVFVDTEHGINTAIRKIRLVLDDNSEQPRFIQTVTGKGYRFVGSLTEIPLLPEQDLSHSFANGDHVEIANLIASPPPEVSPAELPHIDGPQSSNEKTASLQASRPRPWLVTLMALAFLGILVIAFSPATRGFLSRLTHRPQPAKIESIAVLPLDNLSGDLNQEYFADGMTDELITMLTKNSTLRVTSRTSVMQYKGAHRPLREIAQALGVDGILEGSISRSGDKVHMTIQLIQAPTDTHVWAESYDRDPKDIAALPREAALAIAHRLDSAVPSPAPARYVDPQAHDAYLHGRYLWFAGNLTAEEYFRKAVEIQPDYAPGWAGLAMYYEQGSWGDGLVPLQALPLGEAAATRALQLDPSLPEAHLAMGGSNWLYRWDFERADREARRAIELDPKYAEAYQLRAMILTVLNRNSEAIEARKKADELGLFERPYALAMIYNWARQYDAAIENANQHLQATPQDSAMYFELFVGYRGQGMKKEAVQALVKGCSLDGNKACAAGIQRAFEQGGYTAVVRWRIDEYESRASKQYVSSVDLASFHAELGQRDQTLSLLEEAYRQHDPSILFVQTDPAFDFLHSDERYRNIVKKVGLPPAC
jgi:TolB-like protein/DNA-binding winged helix-turn-helix (wHTH) protein